MSLEVTAQMQKVGSMRIIVENFNGELKLRIHFLNILIPVVQFLIILKTNSLLEKKEVLSP